VFTHTRNDAFGDRQLMHVATQGAQPMRAFHSPQPG
jgi:hypothetical protein